MPRSRRLCTVVATAAVCLSGCTSVHFSTASGGTVAAHSSAWQRGFHIGRQARLQHTFAPSATMRQIRAYCDLAAYAKIDGVKRSVVQWADGFDAGCRSTPPQQHGRPGHR